MFEFLNPKWVSGLLMYLDHSLCCVDLTLLQGLLANVSLYSTPRNAPLQLNLTSPTSHAHSTLYSKWGSLTTKQAQYLR